MVKKGEMGKADFVAGELKNIDHWPFPLNKEEVMQEAVTGNPYEYGTCAQFIDKQKEGYNAVSQFMVDVQGTVRNISFLNSVGPCKDPFLKLIGEIRFTPAVKDSSRLPVWMIYPINLNYAYGD